MKLKYLFIAAVALLTVSCGDDDLDSQSIFHDEVVEQNDFDKWLQQNYVDSFNIQFKYRFEYKESDTDYNLAPADYDKAITMAKLTKYLWLDVYAKLAGKDFIRTYCPKILMLVGSLAYDDGQVKLGTAEGGLKITLYNINRLDLNDPGVDIDFLNKWYFHTMHHEFAHILHQTKDYPTEFNEVTKASYQGPAWINLNDSVTCFKMGFVGNYASMEAREDFVEVIATYITSEDDRWNYLLARADTSYHHDIPDAYKNYVGKDVNGKELLLKKLEIITKWFKESWGIDINELRREVLYRSKHYRELDFKDISVNEDNEKK